MDKETKKRVIRYIIEGVIAILNIIAGALISSCNLINYFNL